MTNQQLEKLSTILRALTNPDRLRVILLLQAGELPVNQISHRLGVEQSNLSHMLAKLMACGLVQARRAGRQTFYFSVDSLFIDPRMLVQLGQRALPEATTKPT